MTISTFGYRVTLRQRKEAVIKSCARPLKGIYGMTGRTIFLKTSLYVVWLCGGRIILLVTVDAINPDDIKPYGIF
jgi:hypothetical protein